MQGLKDTSFLTLSTLLLLFCLFASIEAQANEVTSEKKISYTDRAVKPAISIIIDDLGYRLKAGTLAINLPGAVTYAILPHTPHASVLAKQASKLNKEVMLHLPMEAEGGKKLGPGGLTQCMTPEKFKATLNSSLASVPHVKGFNNHMGSFLTKSPMWMNELMQQVAGKDIYFVDSKTTSNSVASRIARQKGVRQIDRDIFLDHYTSTEEIEKQLQRLIKKSRQKGYALAIAHPKPETIKVLKKWLPELEEMGIQLVPVSELIRLKDQRRLAAWQPR